MEPPNPYMPDRFLKQVQVVEAGKATQIRYDIAEFCEFRWMEARFGGWEKSQGLRFRVKIHILGASKGIFLFVYLIFDNDPWSGQWSAKLQCTIRILSQDGKNDLVSLPKTYAIDNMNYYIVAGFPVDKIRKKDSGLIASTGTVRLQADIEWDEVRIVNNYEQLLQYREEVKTQNALAAKERDELIYLRNENRQLRGRLEKMNIERANHLKRIDVICQGQKAAEAYATKLANATQELLTSFKNAEYSTQIADGLRCAPVRPSRSRDMIPDQ